MSHHRLVPLLFAALASLAMVGCAVGTPDDSGEKVAPQGSAYSYRVPDGFQKTDPIDKLNTHSRFMTSVATPDTDEEGAGVVVGEISGLPTVRDAADLRSLLPSFEAEVHQVERAFGAKVSGIMPAKFPGHVAAGWTVAGATRGPFPGLDAKITMVFTSAGNDLVEVTCRSGSDAEERHLIDDACAEVMRSLRVE